MVTVRQLACIFACAAFSPTLALAKGKTKPAPVAPTPVPAPPLPSALLQTYTANNLEHLLGPLNGGGLPRAEMMQMELDFKAKLALAAPAEKGTLQAAVNVCLAFDTIMNEREKAVVSMEGTSHATTSSALGGTRTTHFNDWRDDLQAQREAQEAKARRQQAQNATAFVSAAAVNAANAKWLARGQPWRAQMQQLLMTERQAELAPVPTSATP